MATALATVVWAEKERVNQEAAGGAAREYRYHVKQYYCKRGDRLGLGLNMEEMMRPERRRRRLGETTLSCEISKGR